MIAISKVLKNSTSYCISTSVSGSGRSGGGGDRDGRVGDGDRSASSNGSSGNDVGSTRSASVDNVSGACRSSSGRYRLWLASNAL